MRLFLIALMIALLPLRGWMGDAMALSMAVGHAGTQAQAMAATPMQMPCHAAPTEVTAPAHHGHGAHDLAAGAGHGHLLCDLCNGPVLDVQWRWTPASSEPPLLLPPPNEHFASQTARRDVRPPIS